MAGSSSNPLRALIRAFDRRLRRRMVLTELSADPRQVFRGRVVSAPREVELSGTRIPAGAPVLEIHLKNERLPPLPAGGADLGWGVHAARLALAALADLARRLDAAPELEAVRALWGVTVLPAPGSAAGDLFARLGFTVRPGRPRFGRIGELGENVYSWLLMWAYNPESVAGRPPWRLSRSEIWMSREELLRRHPPARAIGETSCGEAS